MNTRVAYTSAERCRSTITGLIATTSACLLSACALSVPVGEPPQTPEQLVALVMRIADSGQLNDPKSVASILGTTLTLHRKETIRSGDCEREHVSYDVPREYFFWDRLNLYRDQVTDPEAIRPRITQYYLTAYKACGDVTAHVEASLRMDFVLYWNAITLDRLRNQIPSKSLNAEPPVHAFSITYFPQTQNDTLASFRFYQDPRGVPFPGYVSSIYIRQDAHVTKLRNELP